MKIIGIIAALLIAGALLFMGSDSEKQSSQEQANGEPQAQEEVPTPEEEEKKEFFELAEGQWVSEKDSESVLEISGQSYGEYYAGEWLESGQIQAWEEEGGLFSKSIGTLTMVSPDGASREFSVITLTDSHLEMVLNEGNGQTQSYIRKEIADQNSDQ